jgi:hypothetical protein
MARELGPIDISHLPELLRLAEEVRASNRPRVLQRDDVAVAVLMPIQAKPRRPAKNTKRVLDALYASAGSWANIVDSDQLKDDIADTRGSNRPDISLVTRNQNDYKDIPGLVLY